MIDLKLLRSDPERVRDSMTRRGVEFDLDFLAALEAARRGLIGELEAMKAEQNATGKQIAGASADERSAAIEKMRGLSSAVQAKEAELEEAQARLDSALVELPNLVHPDAPPGSGDDANRIVREAGERSQPPFEVRDHLDVGQSLGIIDTERAAKVSGSRFGMLLGAGAVLEMALVRFAWDLIGAKGFVPVIPPVLVREEAMYGTGFFPTDEAQVYKTAGDDLYLAGTSEVPIASMHSGEIIERESLPLRYAGFSTCFRREAGSYGRDVRGIIRVHQFDKVEMFSFTEPEASEDEHALILAAEEEIFSALEIPYRVIEICAGDLAAPNYRKFDIEAWLPGAGRWLEVTSCSNDIDYQARRLGVRTRAGGGTEHVHTLNGTAVAIQRALVALLENHQRPDGSVGIPGALAPYAGFDSVSPGSGSGAPS